MFLTTICKRSYRTLILLSFDWQRTRTTAMSLAHASLLANLKKHNIEVIEKSWVINRDTFSINEINAFITDNQNFNTDLGIGVFIWNENVVQKILDELKASNFPGRIILGGAQISHITEGLEALYPQADIFIRGYAEYALVKTMQIERKNAQPKILGVHYANLQDLKVYAIPPIENLASPILDNIIVPEKFLRWETKRGCPFNCAFCQYKAPKTTIEKCHELPQKRLNQEIEWIASNNVINDISIVDPVFNFGENYIQILRALHTHEYCGNLILECRPELINEDFLSAIEETNDNINVTLKLGLQTIHIEEQKIINRTNNVNKIREVLRTVSKCGIDVEISIIYGLPNQTLSSFKKTIEFCAENSSAKITAFPLMLLPGTALFEQKNQLGLVTATEYFSDKIPRVVEAPTFTRKEWEEMHAIAHFLDKDYNSQHNITSKLLGEIGIFQTQVDKASENPTNSKKKNETDSDFILNHN